MNLNDIATQIIFTTVPILVEKKDGSSSSGTGFIYQKKIDKDRSIPYFVTNAHVVKNAQRGVVSFIKRKENEPDLAEKITVEIPSQTLTSFMNEIDDIAIFPIGPIVNELETRGAPIFFRSIEESLIPSIDVLDNLSAIEEITFVGYPSGLIDSKNNIPIVRKGITATPVWNDFNGKNIFLIDAGVYPGSSGSPVFILNNGAYATNTGFVVGSRIHFLGIVSGTIQREEINNSRVYLGLGQVIKSSVVKDFIDNVTTKLNIT